MIKLIMADHNTAIYSEEWKVLEWKVSNEDFVRSSR
jgi:hypothetical protein